VVRFHVGSVAPQAGRNRFQACWPHCLAVNEDDSASCLVLPTAYSSVFSTKAISNSYNCANMSYFSCYKSGDGFFYLILFKLPFTSILIHLNIFQKTNYILSSNYYKMHCT
jgi:hypothetical protein